MLFNSLAFLYLFLPLCLVMMMLVPKKYSNFMLLVSSIVFYAWGGPAFLKVIFSSLILNYLTAIAINKSSNDKIRKLFFVVGILLNLVMLIVFYPIDLLILAILHFYPMNRFLLYSPYN